MKNQGRKHQTKDNFIGVREKRKGITERAYGYKKDISAARILRYQAYQIRKGDHQTQIKKREASSTDETSPAFNRIKTTRTYNLFPDCAYDIPENCGKNYKYRLKMSDRGEERCGVTLHCFPDLVRALSKQ